MNIPNLLSLLRLLLVPIFAAVFFSPGPNSHRWAALIYAVAFATDIADGYIARRFNMVTKLGRILDPLADKLLTFTALVCIAAKGVIPVWGVVILFCKEALMGLGGLVLYQHAGDVISANLLGKISTGVFFVVLAVLVLFPIPQPWSTALIVPALTLAVAALIRYAVDFLKLMRK